MAVTPRTSSCILALPSVKYTESSWGVMLHRFVASSFDSKEIRHLIGAVHFADLKFGTFKFESDGGVT